MRCIKGGFALALAALLPFAAMAEGNGLTKVNHIVVIYLENHSFDNLMGTFPGADGIAQAGSATVQTDAHDTPYMMLPRVKRENVVDPRVPELPNKPFLITRYIPTSMMTGDLVHRFYQTQQQMNHGKMDKFVAEGNAGAMPMGYYEEKDSPVWQYAQRYTLADHFFTAGLGGSMLNHLLLVCACVPRYEDAPSKLRAVMDTKGRLFNDGALTPDGYVVNTIQPRNPPYDPKADNPKMRLPAQTLPTIGDRLSEKNIDWAWYGGDWDALVAGKLTDYNFPYHHHPFLYFANYAPGKPGRAHLKDENDFVAAIEKGTLPAVSFYKPSGKWDLHPGYTALDSSEKHVFDLVRKLEASPLWKDSLIIVTFDDTGGFWDHVPPPQIDKFGDGGRVPTLVISPFAKKGYVDHTIYDTTSILKLIETRFGLKSLTTRDAEATDLSGALE